MRERIDSIAYSKALGFACGIESINQQFCYSGCLPYPNPRKNPISITNVFAPALSLFWPLGIVILVIKCRIRETITSQITTGVSEIPTFSVTWAIITFSIFFYIYMIIHNTAMALTFLLSELHCHHENGTNGIIPKVGIGMCIALFLSVVLTIAVSTSTKFPNQIGPVPKCALTLCTLVTFKCVSYNRLSKFILHFGIWIVINAFVMCVCYHLPMMFVAILTDPYRHTFIMASIFLFATSTITFTAAVFSIDQVFVSDCRVSIPCKIGIRQGLYWLYITTLSIFGATFLASVHCLLLLDKTLPLSYNINFSWIFSTLTTISIPYVVLNLGSVYNRVMKMHLHGM